MGLTADAVEVRRIFEELVDETDARAVDGEGAIESLLDLDSSARQAAAGLRWDVEEVSLEADRIVPSNHPLGT